MAEWLDRYENNSNQWFKKKTRLVTISSDFEWFIVDNKI